MPSLLCAVCARVFGSPDAQRAGKCPPAQDARLSGRPRRQQLHTGIRSGLLSVHGKGAWLTALTAAQRAQQHPHLSTTDVCVAHLMQADLVLFNLISWLRAGVVSGVPKTLADKHTHIMQVGREGERERGRVGERSAS